jgi:calcineurin-like phosphoesterase family protein
MSNYWLISDLHLGHTNALNFKRADGKPLRPFASVEEMDETIIDNWNKVVGTNDKVCVLGDVVINKKNLYKLDRLKGKKALVMGNHDQLSIEDMSKYFYKVYGAKEHDTCIFTHIPVHTNQLYRFSANIHGHSHSNYTLLDNGERDWRYFNVSCDCDDMEFVPKAWEDIKKILKDRGIVLQSNRSGRIIE